ncbi:MAG: hypothetical protein IH993_03710 [Proteobacteria bacterium]|nr:hypothetical protein [Pseudomonadota bacterium]
MPSFRDIVYGIYGAWRLARRDPGAMTYFERTVEGFWKSFFAAVIVAPGYALILLFDLSHVEIEAGALRIFLVQSCAFVIGWTAFPVAVHHVCEVIDKKEAFIGYVVAFNWGKVIQIAVFLPAIGLIATGILSEETGLFVRWIVSLLILGYMWLIARTALGVSAMGAVGFVVLDLVIDLIIHAVTLGMIR